MVCVVVVRLFCLFNKDLLVGVFLFCLLCCFDLLLTLLCYCRLVVIFVDSISFAGDFCFMCLLDVLLCLRYCEI